jgi:dUTP pyrophosphatase
MMRTFGLLGIPGIIDPGYRGELMIGVMNTNAHEVVVHEGQRIGQMIPMTSPAIGWGIEWVVDLPESDRADRGFGSTGA